MVTIELIHPCNAPLCGEQATKRIVLDSGEVFGEYCDRHVPPAFADATPAASDG